MFTKFFAPSLAVLFALQTISSAYAIKNKRPEADYWKNTGLTLDSLEQRVYPNCNKSEKFLLACLNALNELAGMNKKPVIYATAEEKAQGELGLGELTGTLNYGLNTYSIKTEDFKTNTEWLNAMKKSRNLRQAAAKRLKASTVAIPFSTLIRNLALSLLSENTDLNESYLVSRVLNSYFEVTVDPHTHIMSAEKDLEERSGKAEVFAGVGASIATINKQFVIADFGDSSPAEVAGVHVGDKIIAVDGVSTEGLKTEKVIQMIRGKENTTVVLRLKRAEAELDIAVVRQIIRTENVESKMVNHAGVPYGYIKIRTFMPADAADKVGDAIVELTQLGAKGLILDLRNNPGGDIIQAERITSLFVGHKNTVTLKDLKNGSSRDFIGEGDQITKLPVVTLINANSASASEIVSGALQDYGRGWIVGERSFGKGTAQRVTNFDFSGKIKIAETTSRFYQPSGRTNQIVGILPDFNIDPFPGATDEDRFSLREEDLYSNALPEVGTPWKQPRAKQVEKLSACRTKSGKAEALYSQTSASGRKADYRLIVAEELLTCARN